MIPLLLGVNSDAKIAVLHFNRFDWNNRYFSSFVLASISSFHVVTILLRLLFVIIIVSIDNKSVIIFSTIHHQDCVIEYTSSFYLVVNLNLPYFTKLFIKGVSLKSIVLYLLNSIIGTTSTYSLLITIRYTQYAYCWKYKIYFYYSWCRQST